MRGIDETGLSGGKWKKRNGRHEETRTPDLYRVNHSQTSHNTNLHGTSRFHKSLKRLVDPNKAFLIVHELCAKIGRVQTSLRSISIGTYRPRRVSSRVSHRGSTLLHKRSGEVLPRRSISISNH